MTIASDQDRDEEVVDLLGGRARGAAASSARCRCSAGGEQERDPGDQDRRGDAPLGMPHAVVPTRDRSGGPTPPNPSPATWRRLYPRPIRRQQLVAEVAPEPIRPGGASEAEPVEGVGPALPLLVDPHRGLQVHPGAEQPLELVAGLGAGVADHGPALADHDPLLGVALDPHDGPVAQDLVPPRRSAPRPRRPRRRGRPRAARPSPRSSAAARRGRSRAASRAPARRRASSRADRGRRRPGSSAGPRAAGLEISATQRVDARRRCGPRAGRTRRSRRARPTPARAARRSRRGSRRRSCSPRGCSASRTRPTSSAMKRSPGPTDSRSPRRAGTRRRPRRASRPNARCTARRAACAACGCPGVSSSTICESAVVRTPRTWVRVVCGRLETIETFVPTSWFTSVDFPTLGRPTRVTNPERNSRHELPGRRALSARTASAVASAARSSSGVRDRHDRDRRDAPALDPLGAELEALEPHGLPRLGHVAEQVEHEAADGVPLGVGQLDARAPRSRRRSASGPARAMPPPASGSTPGSSMSYSSTISPTISSSRSSSVTSPAVPPCSSITIAMWNFSVRISRSSSATRFCSGTNTASRTATRTGSAPGAGAGLVHEVLQVHEADDVVGRRPRSRGCARSRPRWRGSIAVLDGLVGRRSRPCRDAARITSRTTVSPNSKIEWMSRRSSRSIASSSAATSAIVRRSSSVTNGPSFRPLPGSITFARPMRPRREQAQRREVRDRPEERARAAARRGRGAGSRTSSARPRRSRSTGRSAARGR